MRSFDLRSLRFDDKDEAWRRLPVDVDPFVLGGTKYAVRDGGVELDLGAARVGDRITLTGSFETALQGPCERCLDPAEVPFRLSATEVARQGESEGYDDDEKYVRHHYLDPRSDRGGDALSDPVQGRVRGVMPHLRSQPQPRAGPQALTAASISICASPPIPSTVVRP
jgi:hypothetical protein